MESTLGTKSRSCRSRAWSGAAAEPGDVPPLRPLGLCCSPYEATRLCPVILPHITYLGVICVLHLLQQRLQGLQVKADIVGFLQT